MSEPEVIPLRGGGAVDTKAKPSFMRRMRWPLIVGGPLLIAVGVAYLILTGGKTQTTDNAYVQMICHRATNELDGQSRPTGD